MDREQMQEVINGMRKIVKPYLANQLKKINFEGYGNTDKAEFETDFEIVLTLAEQALTIPSEDRWIPCSEGRPEEGGRYLVYTWSHEIETAQYVDGYWNIKTPISAWMPLPKPYLSDTNIGNMSENPTSSEPQETKPEISSYYGLRSYVRERSDKE